MKERVILHCDINHCYAQIEEMKVPSLRGVAMAVGGQEENRHGIILAKNDIAKKYNIITGESLREAYKKCPHLLVIHPHYEEYVYYTEKIKDIYREYSDHVESFGLDEAWIDCTDSALLFGSGEKIADEIQTRVLNEFGITISVGVSFNKIFAKLGSDMVKPAGLVVITKENYRSKIGSLPVEDLFYVGSATKSKLHELNIHTIGELADCDIQILKKQLGKMGETIYWFANGKDVSEVALSGTKVKAKSVSHGITASKDIKNLREAKLIFSVLCEAVASSLREMGMRGGCLSIGYRTCDLKWYTRQCRLKESTDLSAEMIAEAMQLLQKNYDFHHPLRSLSVSMSKLESNLSFRQMSLFDEEKKAKTKKLEKTMDEIRSHYGFYKIQRCSMLLDKQLTSFDPKGEHVIYPGCMI